MKKLVSIVLSAAMVFTLGMAVFAAEDLPSVTAGEGNVTVDSATDDNGDDVNIIISATELTQDQEASLADAVADAVGDAEVDALEVLDVTADGVVGFPVKVTFIRSTDDEVLAVLYWNEDTNSWDVADFTQDGTEVTVTFDHFCSVIFAIKEVSSSPANPGNNDDSSAQTGYSEIIYIVAAVALVGGAVFCFANSRKQVAM